MPSCTSTMRTDTVGSASTTRTRRLRPLSERILARLPGPRWAWVLLWALLPWANAGVNLLLDDDARSAVWEQGRVIVVLNYTALSFAIVMTLWGTTRLARQMELLDQASAPANDGEQTHVFGALNPVAGPLLASAATAAAFGGSSGVAGGWAAALVRGTTWFVLGIAIWTFLWTYGAVQLGLARFGRTPLHVEAVRADPALGLQPLGEVAFMGLWMLLVWLVPVLLTGLPDVVGAVV